MGKQNKFKLGLIIFAAFLSAHLGLAISRKGTLESCRVVNPAMGRIKSEVYVLVKCTPLTASNLAYRSEK